MPVLYRLLPPPVAFSALLLSTYPASEGRAGVSYAQIVSGSRAQLRVQLPQVLTAHGAAPRALQGMRRANCPSAERGEGHPTSPASPVAILLRAGLPRRVEPVRKLEGRRTRGTLQIRVSHTGGARRRREAEKACCFHR